jgi:hypothetical protein
MTALTRPLAALRRMPRPRFPDRPRPQTEARSARPAVRTGQGKILTGLGRSSVTAVTCLVIVTAAASFTESYRALFEWASRHGVAGFWAAIWPLQIDTFIAVGELALVAALVYGWSRKVRASWWTITLAGLAVSVAGNVGHLAAGNLATRVTAAVPPVAAAVALAAGLGMLKRLAERQATITAPVPAIPAIASAEAPPADRAAKLPATALDPDALAALDSGAKRARLAAAVLGTASPAAVAAALADAGHPITTEAARSALRNRPQPEGNGTGRLALAPTGTG